MNAAEESNIIQLPTNEQQQNQPAQTYPASAPNPDPTGLGNLEKIREIIFGSQMRDYDRRFAKLEERLLKEAGDVREETRRRFETLENFIKQEVSALGERVKAESQQRTTSDEDVTRELRETARTIGQKINQLDEQTAQAQRELREQILTQSRELADDIRRKYEDLSGTVAREARELRNDKTDRAALANLFTELAMRLNHEFKLPGEE